MGKIFQTRINTFSGGLSEDKRVKDASKYSLTKNFDVFTYPHKLVPYHKTEAIETKAYDIVKFLYANGTFYGYGVVSGSTKAAVYTQALTTNDAWQIPANNQSASNGRMEEVFFYYKGYIYMWRTSYLMRFDTAGGAWGDSYFNTAETITSLAQPVHHPSDDIAYFFHNNFVHSLNDTSWDDKVLTLPSNLKIVSACPYGNYLAIGCTTTDAIDARAIVFLWDRDSSLTTLSERVDFGAGSLLHLATLNNNLIAVVDYYTSNLIGQRRGKLSVRAASGQSFVTLNEITTDDTNATQSNSIRLVDDNKLYFPAGMELNGDSRLGVWVVDGSGRVSLAFVEEEATTYEGIYKTGNQWWIAHSNDGSVNRSDDNLGYSATGPAVYESLVFNTGESTKKLLGVTVTHEPLIVGATVTLKYRKDAETSWTTIFTHDVDDSLSHEAINIESSGANLPEFEEIQFRIESVGATITSLSFKVEEIDRGLY